MKIKKNAISNYIKQIYVIFIGILILPFYMNYLGPAAFGLIGFFAAVQSCLRLLDMGFTPALSREVAFVHGSAQNYFELKQLLRSLEIIFLMLATSVSFLICFFSNYIAGHWFKSEELPLIDIAHSIMLMGVIFGVRWLNDLYVAGLLGFEKQVQLNVINIITVTLQYSGALILLKYVSHNVVYYFNFLAIIAIIQLLTNAVLFYRVFPKTDFLGLCISVDQIKKVLPLALGSAYSSIVWVLATQSDKLVFSHILSLTQYGYFSLVIIIAAGVGQFSAPIVQAVLPRLIYYFSRHEYQNMLNLYCKSTNYICIIIFSIAGCVVVFSKPLLYAWSGNMQAADFGAPILVWYVLASGILAVAGLQYSLQVANGSLRLHAYYNTIAVCIKTPLIIFVALRYGVYATAITWFFLMLISFLVWVPIVHQRYAKGMHFRWIKNVILIFLTALFIFYMLNYISLSFYDNRANDFLKLCAVGLVSLCFLIAAVKIETKLKWIL
ncbi:MAG: oligosaccharide flippase family protein [Gammaproteobacteria bacterium]|nr:oligosaccharide flippase family protein [Gammaproteobacteria bacterium]